jgi:tRNA-splicing ligase RtcB
MWRRAVPAGFLRRASSLQLAFASTSTPAAGSPGPAGGFQNLATDSSSVEVRCWVNGIEQLEPSAVEQLRRIASMTDIVKHPVAAMPDIHLGNGVAVGAVIPTTKAIIPSAVGVDIGCGVIAVKTSIREEHLPSNLEELRLAIEMAIPHGRTHNGNPDNDAGSWRNKPPKLVMDAWRSTPALLDTWSAKGRAVGSLARRARGASPEPDQTLEERFKRLCIKHPALEYANHVNHLGTLGTGNHFIEVAIDEGGHAWFIVHSGSRGVGSRIGTVFIELAKKDMGNLLSTIPSAELAYVREGTTLFDDYVEALEWAQDFARANRLVMMTNMINAVKEVPGIPKDFKTDTTAVNCHHNYVERYHLGGVDFRTDEHVKDDGGETVWLTRKGATSARAGEYGIVPGSMGTPTFIVRGRGNPEAYNSCAHGAGRAYSRGEALRRFTLDEHIEATKGVCCRKDKDVVDETPMAYKDIAAVMRAQADLVEVVHTLRQVVCVKG